MKKTTYYIWISWEDRFDYQVKDYPECLKKAIKKVCPMLKDYPDVRIRSFMARRTVNDCKGNTVLREFLVYKVKTSTQKVILRTLIDDPRISIDTKYPKELYR